MSNNMIYRARHALRARPSLASLGAGELSRWSPKRIGCALVGLLLLTYSVAHAEIEKIAIPGENGLSVHWWPKLAPLNGWHQDREHSLFYGANALAPDGNTFKNAETVMYALAIFKPRAPDIKSLAALIESDRKEFEASVPGISIHEVAAISSFDGQKFRSFTFFPTSEGNWERVSYGEEGEFYLVFTVSSRTRSGFNAAVGAYEKLIIGYNQIPDPAVHGTPPDRAPKRP